MMFLEPMRAGEMPKPGLKALTGLLAMGCVAEEKYDGERLIVAVLQGQRDYRAWSRNGLPRLLPEHVVEELLKLPWGLYDGELRVPGKKSYAVKQRPLELQRGYVIFDVLELLGVSTRDETYERRRAYLTYMVEEGALAVEGAVMLSTAWPVMTVEMVETLLNAVWQAGGEGLILKRTKSRYSVGKRPKGDWVKLKKKAEACLTVIGFAPGQGLIQDNGPYARVLLRDDEGYETSVKTKNHKELAAFDALGPSGISTMLGRRLWIAFQERTKDHGYREPRWTRWAEEGE